MQIDEILNFYLKKTSINVFCNYSSCYFKNFTKIFAKPKKVTIDAKEIVNTNIKQEFVNVAKVKNIQNYLRS